MNRFIYISLTIFLLIYVYIPVFSSNLEITLFNAIVSDKEIYDLRLEINEENLKLNGNVFGTSWYNDAAHTGKIKSINFTPEGKITNIEVIMYINRYLCHDNGGIAKYDICLNNSTSNIYCGSFTGQFLKLNLPIDLSLKLNSKPEPISNGRDSANQSKRTSLLINLYDYDIECTGRLSVSGKVVARELTDWPIKTDIFFPVVKNEHPRLMFRRAQIPYLRQLVSANFEGVCMFRHFLKMIDTRTSILADRKIVDWSGMGFALAYLLMNNKEYLDKAQEILVKLLDDKSEEFLYNSTRLLELSLLFDFIYDSLSKDTLQRCVDVIGKRILECYTGTVDGRPMKGINFELSSSCNAIRASVIGLAALAIMDEENSRNTVFIDLPDIADRMAWEVREYIRLGLGGGAWCREGMFYKGLALQRGLLHFLHAYKLVKGKNIIGERYGEHILLGYVIEAEPGSIFPKSFHMNCMNSDLSIYGEKLPYIVWSTIFGFIPEKYKPYIKYIFDRNFGIKIMGNFGIETAGYFPFIISLYPYNIEEQPPDENLPWISPDPDNGHWVFRPRWYNKNDILLTFNFKTPASIREDKRDGRVSELRLIGYGIEWLNGRYLPTVSNAVELISDKDGFATSWWYKEDRICQIAFNTGEVYSCSKKENYNEASLSGICGCTIERILLIDCSKKSGAPLLIAGVEMLWKKHNEGKDKLCYKWSLPFAKGLIPEVKGRKFNIKQGTGFLNGEIFGVKSLNSDGSALADTGFLGFIFTLSDKDLSSSISIEFINNIWNVNVGNRKIIFDGRKFSVIQ